MSPTQHPNATLAGGATGGALFVVWILGYFGVNISAELGAVVSGGLATVLLFIGRKGLCGVVEFLLHGSEGKKKGK